MVNLDSLRQHQTHPLKPIFDRYNRAQIANKLGIGPTYLGNILQGHYQPGADLEVRMQELAYLESVQPDPGEYLFQSRKGGHITSQSVGRLVKTWCKAINLEGNYGAHTLRKTWGYHQRKNHGVGFEILCKRYNHSSPSITMGYLGIESKEVRDVLMNEIG